MSDSTLGNIPPDTSFQNDSSSRSHLGSTEVSASALSPESIQQPRGTGQTRRPPDKYSEWVSHQQSVVDADSTQVWYV